MTEFSGNVSVEGSQTGWTGTYNSSSNVALGQPASGSYDGSWALQVSPEAGYFGAAGVNNAKPIWMPGLPGTASVAGASYTGSAYVQASVAGEQVSLLVRETTPTGSGVGYHTTTITLPETGWYQITSSYLAKNSGDAIRYSLYASNFASSSQYFLADCLSLQTPTG